jgi:glycosyltransferase involved in cell wall biosynthesis
MPRIGQNPAKFVDVVEQPAPVTVAVLSYIPFLAGFYTESLEVLRISLRSILKQTQQPFDLMVFDNGSCAEVIDFLKGMRANGSIQYLMLSSENLGKVGAWNFIFRAAPGEYIAYSDSDILYLPGWLEKHLEIFNAYPDVGTVTGLPRRRRPDFSEHTIERVKVHPSIELTIGKSLPEEWIIDHARSLDKEDELAVDLARDDYHLLCNGVEAYVTAQHFQFVIRKDVIRPFLPFSYERPMGSDVAKFDRAIDGSGLLRLATAERSVLHMGNVVDSELLQRVRGGILESASPRSVSRSARGMIWKLIHWRPIRWFLLGIYNRIFRLYYSS